MTNFLRHPQRRLTLTAVLAACGSITAAEAGEYGSLGSVLCQMVSVPACMLDKATFRSPSGMAACDKHVDEYVKALADFRNCMLTESQRTISDANDLLFSYHCQEGRATECTR